MARIFRRVRLQLSSPPALKQSLVKRGLLVRLGLGWFERVLTCKAHHFPRCEYDCRVMLMEARTYRSCRWSRTAPTMAPLLGVGAARGRATQESVRRSGRVLTPNVRKRAFSRWGRVRPHWSSMCYVPQYAVYAYVYGRLEVTSSWHSVGLFFALARYGYRRLRLRRLQPVLQRSAHCWCLGNSIHYPHSTCKVLLRVAWYHSTHRLRLTCATSHVR